MIRHATSLDIEKIVQFVKEFYPYTPYINQVEFDDETVTNLTTHLIKNGIVLLAIHEENIVGIFGGHVVPHMFNANQLGCNEAIWYVTPEHQRSGFGIQLIEKADRIRKLRGCKTFQMMRVQGSSPKLDELFVNLGFSPTEFCFTKVN